MKRRFNKTYKLTALLLLAGILITGCTAKSTPEPKATDNGSAESVEIIATLFPQYDFAKALTKDMDAVSIRLLMPPGTEAHNYEPTPKDLADIQSADVFIYTSFAMEPWVEKMLTQIGPNTIVIDATKGVEYKTADALGLDVHEAHADETGSDAHDHEGIDPHVWLDPENAAIMAKNVADGIRQVMPDKAAAIDASLQAYQSELKTLDQKIADRLSQFKQREIIFAGHFAFGYFSSKYNLVYHSPYEGFSPDAEPAPQKIAEMVDLMKSENHTAVYYEELIDPKIARIIAEETGAKLLMLHAAHNVSKDELKQNVTYVQIMEANLTKLEEGLK